MGGFDTLTRHFSHQALTDENEWCSLKEVAFGIDYIVQFFLLLFMGLTVFLVLFLSFTVLIKLIFSFTYNHFSKKISISIK